jgi:tRNA G18 (ribose-2'-O)-methylase SpoU
VADAFGVEQIVFLNMTDGLGKRFKKTSRSAEKYVPYLISDNFEAIYGDLKKRHYQFLALEITHQSLPLNEFKLTKDQPVALIVGGENMGISDSILNEVETHLHISMYGVNSSMNVVQSAAIALYELSTQLK